MEVLSRQVGREGRDLQPLALTLVPSPALAPWLPVLLWGWCCQLRKVVLPAPIPELLWVQPIFPPKIMVWQIPAPSAPWAGWDKGGCGRAEVAEGLQVSH